MFSEVREPLCEKLDIWISLPMLTKLELDTFFFFFLWRGINFMEWEQAAGGSWPSLIVERNLFSFKGVRRLTTFLLMYYFLCFCGFLIFYIFKDQKIILANTIKLSRFLGSCQTYWIVDMEEIYFLKWGTLHYLNNTEIVILFISPYLDKSLDIFQGNFDMSADRWTHSISR